MAKSNDKTARFNVRVSEERKRELTVVSQVTDISEASIVRQGVKIRIDELRRQYPELQKHLTPSE